MRGQIIVGKKVKLRDPGLGSHRFSPSTTQANLRDSASHLSISKLHLRLKRRAD